MTSRPHPGTERSLTAAVLQFDLSREVERLKQEPDWTGGKRTIALTKQGDLRVVLIALLAGATLDEHFAPGALTVHMLEGRVTITIANDAWTVAAGELLALRPGLRHAVRAAEDSVLLLTLLQPAAH